MIEDFENRLEQYVLSIIHRDEYPDVKALVLQKSMYAEELLNLEMDTIPRPATKELYFARLAELKALIVEIALGIEAGKQATLDKWDADVAAAKLDQTVINAATLKCIEEDYPPRFVALQTAYNGAMILNDTVTMASITEEYQNLLSEYNAAKEAVS